MASHQSNGVDALTQRLGMPSHHLTADVTGQQLANYLDGVTVKDSMHAPATNGLAQKAAYIPPHMREKIQQGGSFARYLSVKELLTSSTEAPPANGWGNPQARPFQPR